MAHLPQEEADRPSDQPEMYDVVMIQCNAYVVLHFYIFQNFTQNSLGSHGLISTLPSLTLPFPLMMILAPVSFSMFFNVFPRGPDTIVSISHL